jgi:hypothetical protein
MTAISPKQAPGPSLLSSTDSWPAAFRPETKPSITTYIVEPPLPSSTMSSGLVALLICKLQNSSALLLGEISKVHTARQQVGKLLALAPGGAPPMRGGASIQLVLIHFKGIGQGVRGSKPFCRSGS